MNFYNSMHCKGYDYILWFCDQNRLILVKLIVIIPHYCSLTTEILGLCQRWLFILSVFLGGGETGGDVDSIASYTVSKNRLHHQRSPT